MVFETTVILFLPHLKTNDGDKGEASTSCIRKGGKMNRLRFQLPVLVLAVLLGAVLAVSVMAQETTTPAPVVIGDANAESLQVVQSYLDTRDPNLLAEDIAYYEPGVAGPITSRGVITQTESLLYNQAFTDTASVPIRYIVADEGFVIVEMEFTGLNTGPYLQQPATDREVLIPMVGVYLVETGQIIEARLYYDTNELYTQLGYGVGPGVAGVGAPGPTP